MFDDETDLSQPGQARREQILRLALSEARTRRRRRQAARIGVMGILLLLAGTALISRRSEPPTPALVAIDPPARIESPPKPFITYIQTDPTVVERLSIRPRAATWAFIGDDELLDALADAGQPAGIIYHDGIATLLAR